MAPVHLGLRRPGLVAGQPRSERHAALLLRQHVPRPSRRAADRLRRLRGRRPGARPGAGRRARVLDEDHVNNASFLTLPGRRAGTLQVHLFSHASSPYGDYDGANDASLVFHEYTHGLSNRLVTDAQGFGALNTRAGRRDRRGHERLLRARLPRRGAAIADDPDVADVRLGELPRRRRRDTGCACSRSTPRCRPASPTPTSARSPASPRSTADGEIWAQTLWDLRADARRRRPPRARRHRGDAPLPARAVVPRHAQRDPPGEQRGRRRDLGGLRRARDGLLRLDRRQRGHRAGRRHERSAAAGRSSGTVRGIVRDDDGQPLAGAHVGIAGHDTQGRGGLGPQLAADTDAERRLPVRRAGRPLPADDRQPRRASRGARRRAW